VSIEFEMETDLDLPPRTSPRRFLVDAYSTDACLEISRGEDDGIGATFPAEQMRKLRRFLEYVYPASEDPPHDPDPWVTPSRYPEGSALAALDARGQVRHAVPGGPSIEEIRSIVKRQWAEMVKACVHCQTAKPRSEYGPNKRARDGLQYWCRACMQEAARASKAKLPADVRRRRALGYQNAARSKAGNDKKPGGEG
jgi:hypothetical protein